MLLAYELLFGHAENSDRSFLLALSGLKAYAAALALESGAEEAGFAGVQPIMAAFVSEAAQGVRNATTVPPRVRDILRDYFFAQLNLTEELYGQLSEGTRGVTAEALRSAVVPVSADPTIATDGETLAGLACEPLFAPGTPQGSGAVALGGPVLAAAPLRFREQQRA